MATLIARANFAEDPTFVRRVRTAMVNTATDVAAVWDAFAG